MTSRAAIAYHLRILRREQLWMPAGLFALFVLIVVLMRQDAARARENAGVFLGVMVPLLAGILAAPAIVDDPALELQLAAPRAPWRILVERLAIILGLAGLAAILFQAVAAAAGVDLSVLGPPLRRQLAWLAPSIALMALASAAALTFRNGMTGALVVGLLWIVQLLMRGWFASSPWARYVFLFMGVRQPASAALPFNQLTLCLIGAALLVASALMLRREERYL